MIATVPGLVFRTSTLALAIESTSWRADVLAVTTRCVHISLRHRAR
jgi:hypothetical protein